MGDARTIVFFPEGAYGPTNNCVGIGQVLRGRGHRVVFILEESFAGTLTAFDIGPDGSLSNRRVWAALPGDGIVLDTEGAVWTPGWVENGPACLRVAEGGEVLATVPRPDGSEHVVAVRQGSLLATSFHPEVGGDPRVHARFVALVRAGG